MIKFNPVASDIIATSAFDWMIKVWNLSENSKEVTTLEVRKSETIHFLPLPYAICIFNGG